MDEKQRIIMATQIGQGLIYCHKQGIILDQSGLSPRAIKVTDYWDVKISDAGLSKLRSRAEGQLSGLAGRCSIDDLSIFNLRVPEFANQKPGQKPPVENITSNLFTFGYLVWRIFQRSRSKITSYGNINFRVIKLQETIYPSPSVTNEFYDPHGDVPLELGWRDLINACLKFDPVDRITLFNKYSSNLFH